jgi:predicted anti-sigma-YlaC factor YlaD
MVRGGVLDHPRSKTTLRRLAFRLLVIIAFSALWPGFSAGLATAVLCMLLAAAVVVTAVAYREPFLHAGLNCWHEAAALLAIACIVLLAR